MKPKRIISLLLALCLVLALAACSAPTPKPTDAPAPTQTPAPTAAPQPTQAPTETPAPTEEPEVTDAPPVPGEALTVEYTDDTGRTLAIPAEITRLAVTGPMSQIVLFALAPEKLVATANKWDPGAEAYFAPEYFNLPNLGQLYGGKGELNLEELLAAAPEIVLDIGEPKKSIGEDLAALTEQTGIPFIHIDAFTATMPDAYRKLGTLLGLEDRAEVLAQYCEEIMALAEDTMAKVGENRVKMLYLLGDEGLNVIAEGSYHSEIIDLVADNAAVLEDPSSKGTGNETDMEQLLLWDPDYIVFSYDSVGDKVGEDPLWQQLSAVKNGNYAKSPYGPYNWMGFPASVQRYLGILWLLKTLYPDYVDYDLFTEVNRFYELFFHCTLTEEQYQAILG